jgi:hypothetical protein
MAKIVPSDTAPDEAVRYSFGNAEFELGGKKGSSFETTDPVLIRDASLHPWLTVEVEAAEAPKGVYSSGSVPAAEDPFTREGNQVAYNDPKVAAEAVESVEDVTPVAIEAGQDQKKPVVRGGVAETLAADDTPDSKKG